MAGSYNHAVDERTGKLLNNEQCVSMAAENGGDAYETIEEMYGMIWYLASQLQSAEEAEATRTPTDEERPRLIAELVEEARTNYQVGLLASPGTDGELDDDDE